MEITAEKKAEAAQLMAKYRETGSQEIRNQLVMHYSYIAKAVASQMRGYTANYAQLEDIVNQGIITLIDCIEKFDPEKGMKFESYAFMRVKCANIDFIRQQDWLPRRVRKNAKEIAAAYDQLSNQLMREPSIKELAAFMELPEELLQKHYGEISNSVMISLDTVLQSSVQDGDEMDISSGNDQLPEERLISNELRQQLVGAIEKLSQRERLVVSLYYYEHLRLFEIANVMGVSESRVCQLHSRAIGKMRDIMQRYMESR